jgi:FkbM family methyltransferase
MKLFEQERPRDTNIEAAVAREQREITFYLYKYSNFNSADKRFSSEALGVDRNDFPDYCVGEQKVVTRTLREILDQNLPAGQRIDFLSVDVEGMDMEVLQSNDWQHFRPRYILVECALNLSANEVADNEVGQFLEQQDYELFAKTCNTAIFRDVLDVLPLNPV